MSPHALRNSKAPDLVHTAGEVFSPGHFLEIVRDPGDHDRTLLLHQQGRRTKVSCEFELDGKKFEPVPVATADLRATRIPALPLAKGRTASELLLSLTTLICELGITKAHAERVSIWCLSTWVGDALASQPAAFISGPDAHEGLCFLRLLHALCRRPVLVGATRAAVGHALQPLFETLLIFRPELGPKYLRNLLAYSSYRGIYVAGNKNLHEVCRPTAVFVSDDAPQHDYFEGECVRVSLDDQSTCAALKPDRIEEIAAKFQPQLLAYRLANWVTVHNAETRAPNFCSPIKHVATTLAACAVGKEELKDRIFSLFVEDDEQERARRSTDIRTVIPEVLLALVHMGEQQIAVKELASKVNSLLRDRGDFREYSPMEVGRKLRDLSFAPRRRSQGRMLLLGPDENRRIHQLATCLRVAEFQKPKQTCTFCKELQEPVSKGLM